MPSSSRIWASAKCPMRHLAITGIETAPMISRIFFGCAMRATPPSARICAGTRSSAITATAPAFSAISAWRASVTSIITPPFSISASPTFSRKPLVPLLSVINFSPPGSPLRTSSPGTHIPSSSLFLNIGTDHCTASPAVGQRRCTTLRRPAFDRQPSATRNSKLLLPRRPRRPHHQRLAPRHTAHVRSIPLCHKALREALRLVQRGHPMIRHRCLLLRRAARQRQHQIRLAGKGKYPVTRPVRASHGTSFGSATSSSLSPRAKRGEAHPSRGISRFRSFPLRIQSLNGITSLRPEHPPRVHLEELPPAGRQRLPRSISDLRRVDVLPPAHPHLARLHRQRPAQWHRTQIPHFHLRRHRQHLPRLVQLRHRFIQDGRD